mmetsp:Transcript_402/g.1068  ORF Transcript_402/g.1068 Transcript_402/m.1068 type:complete len:324 (+) Transcript_402:2378-3349(+)
MAYVHHEIKTRHSSTTVDRFPYVPTVALHLLSLLRLRLYPRRNRVRRRLRLAQLVKQRVLVELPLLPFVEVLHVRYAVQDPLRFQDVCVLVQERPLNNPAPVAGHLEAGVGKQDQNFLHARLAKVLHQVPLRVGLNAATVLVHTRMLDSQRRDTVLDVLGHLGPDLKPQRQLARKLFRQLDRHAPKPAANVQVIDRWRRNALLLRLLVFLGKVLGPIVLARLDRRGKAPRHERVAVGPLAILSLLRQLTFPTHLAHIERIRRRWLHGEETVAESRSLWSRARSRKCMLHSTPHTHRIALFRQLSWMFFTIPCVITHSRGPMRK